MTQGVVSMSARQVAPRKNTSKTFLMVSAARSALPGSAMVEVHPELAPQVLEFAQKQQQQQPRATKYGMIDLVQQQKNLGLSRKEKNAVTTVRKFLRQAREDSTREMNNTVRFLNNSRLHEVVNTMNKQLDALTTGDLYFKNYLVDKKRGASIRDALIEARANIIKQEQPLLVKMTNFNWVNHAEVWDKELKGIQKKVESFTSTNSTVPTPYAFGQPNIFNALVTPVTVSDAAWKKTVSTFQRTMEEYAKRNVEQTQKMVKALKSADRKKLNMVSKNKFQTMCNNIFRDFESGKLRKDTFMKWIKAQLHNKRKADAEMDQFTASMGILNSYFKSLDPNNAHVITAMNKAKVHEIVYKNVLHTMAKELEASLRYEGDVLKNMTQNMLAGAISHGDNRYSKLLKGINVAYNKGVEANPENSLEYAILATPNKFLELLANNYFKPQSLQSRMDNEEFKLEKMSDPELGHRLFLSTALRHCAAYEAQKEEQTSAAAETGFESILTSAIA